jgi:hypothetical protein
MKTLILMAFEYGGEGEFFQVVEDGVALGFVTLTGEPLTLPLSCGYMVVDASPALPAWFDASPTPSDPVAPPVPDTITALQARLVLNGMGALDAVEAFIAEAGGAAKIVWEYATVIERHSPLVSGAAAALGMTEEQMDDLFRTAATL